MMDFDRVKIVSKFELYHTSYNCSRTIRNKRIFLFNLLRRLTSKVKNNKFDKIGLSPYTKFLRACYSYRVISDSKRSVDALNLKNHTSKFSNSYLQ